jgi:hypothetical protein
MPVYSVPSIQKIFQVPFRCKQVEERNVTSPHSKGDSSTDWNLFIYKKNLGIHPQLAGIIEF